MKNFLALSVMLAWAGLAQGIELIDSGILFGEFPRLYWMDNQRVILLTRAENYPEMKGSAR